jgi:hypothetical protein
MSYSAFLKPRPETISEDGVEGIIDLANIRDETKNKLEARPDDFFELTYPTSDISRVIENINLRFFSKKHSSGLFLFEGLKGCGKSHLLLLIYNLFKYQQIAHLWLSKNGFSWNAPKDPLVIINKFTDEPSESLWDKIFHELGLPPYKGKTHPKLSEFQKALKNRIIILIFDELEQGIKVISEQALKSQNIAFLQMLSEFSNRSPQITMFASIYSDREDPGSTLKRVPRCEVKFDNTRDQGHIILHRLFENYTEFNNKKILPVVESYVQLWNRYTPIDMEVNKQKLLDTFPFSSSIIDIILKRIPARGGFQNVRGALAFLGNLVRLTYQINDIITPADASLEDQATVIMLKDLNPGGDLIKRAKENMEDLIPRTSLAKKIAPSVLLHTLTGLGSSPGVSREQLIQDVITPAVDINSFELGLSIFQKYGSYFWHQEGRYYFDLSENPEAKVELKSIQYKDPLAIEKLSDILKEEVFKETENVAIFESVEQVKELLNQFEKNRPRYVFAGRRMPQEERHSLYFGLDNRNMILLFEPKDDQFQLTKDKDMLKWAKRVLAAKDLAESTSNASRQAEYQRIARQDQGYIIDRIKKAGLVFVSWENYGSSVSEDKIELEPLPSDFSKDRVLEKLYQDYFPILRFREHLEQRLDSIKERLVKEIDAEYRSTLSFPVPVNVRVVSSALRDLCKEGIIGIQHSSGNYCWKTPALTETEFLNAKVTSPFEMPPEKDVCPVCGKKPCQCPLPSPQPCPNCAKYPCECEPRPSEVCPNCNQDPCVCKTKEQISLKILPQNSILDLRQETAFRLQDYEGASIKKISFKIFYSKNEISDLSSLPTALRGSLSGQGDIIAEIMISKSGNFTKTQIEQFVESLPAIPGADYSADMVLEINKKDKKNGANGDFSL